MASPDLLFIKRLMNKKTLIRLVNIVILTFFAVYLWNNIEIFKELKHLTLTHILLIALVQITSIYLQGYMNFEVIKKFDIKVKEFFGLQITTNFINKFTPKGGAIFRSVYLKKIYKFNYSNFLGTLMGTYMVTFLSSSIFSLFLIYYLYLKFGITNHYLSLILVGIVVFCSLLITKSIKVKTKGKITRNISKVVAGFDKIKEDKALMFKLVIIAILGILSHSCRFYLILDGIGIEVQIYQVLFISIISFLSQIIAITPDNIGIQEGSLAVFTTAIQLPIATIIFANLIFRAISLIVPFLLGPIFYYKYARSTNWKEKINNLDSNE
jgi:uncharacterized protein (TIRG00374 family)